jgi:hypothetical protein
VEGKIGISVLVVVKQKMQTVLRLKVVVKRVLLERITFGDVELLVIITILAENVMQRSI